MSSKVEERFGYKFQAKDFTKFAPYGVSTNDIRLITDYSENPHIKAGLKTNITPSIELYHPFLPSAMNTISRAEMLKIFALSGSIGFIDRGLSPKDQAAELRKVKRYSPDVVHDPVTLNRGDKTDRVIQIKEKLGYDSVPIVDGNGVLEGVISYKNIGTRYLGEYVKNVMKDIDPSAILLETSTEDEIEVALLNSGSKVYLVDEDKKLKGVVFYKDWERAKRYPNASKDDQGRLRAGAAVGGAVTKDLELRAKLLADEGVDVYLIDVSQAASRGVKKTIQYLRDEYPHIEIIAGNVDNYDAAAMLASWGAHAVKAGIGVGSICKTTLQVGGGQPQGNAIAGCNLVCEEAGIYLIADGGIKYPKDAVIALALGSHAVMGGNIFAGTKQTPGKVMRRQNQDGSYFEYKIYEGMGSIRNIIAAGGSRYYEDANAEDIIEHGVVKEIPYRGSVEPILNDFINATADAISCYYGFDSLRKFRQGDVWMTIQSAAASAESAPSN
jgi:IMP dehydrogenase